MPNSPKSKKLPVNPVLQAYIDRVNRQTPKPRASISEQSSINILLACAMALFTSGVVVTGYLLKGSQETQAAVVETACGALSKLDALDRDVDEMKKYLDQHQEVCNRIQQEQQTMMVVANRVAIQKAEEEKSKVSSVDEITTDR